MNEGELERKCLFLREKAVCTRLVTPNSCTLASLFKDAYIQRAGVTRAATLWKYPGSSFVTVKYILKKKTTNEITWKMAWVHPARKSCMFLLSDLFLLQFSSERHRDRKR